MTGLPLDVQAKINTDAEYFEYNGKTYNVTFGNYLTRHGGPFDRGSADSYYGRQTSPHYYPLGTGKGARVEESAMTKDEIAEYYAGYEYNEKQGDKKEW